MKPADSSPETAWAPWADFSTLMWIVNLVIVAILLAIPRTAGSSGATDPVKPENVAGTNGPTVDDEDVLRVSVGPDGTIRLNGQVLGNTSDPESARQRLREAASRSGRPAQLVLVLWNDQSFHPMFDALTLFDEEGFEVSLSRGGSPQ